MTGAKLKLTSIFSIKIKLKSKLAKQDHHHHQNDGSSIIFTFFIKWLGEGLRIFFSNQVPGTTNVRASGSSIHFEQQGFINV